MKKFVLFASALLLSATAALAAAAKSYQVTGPVTEINDSYITVQKGNEKWQIARDGSTKLPADMKVGSKVTVRYTMTAAEVEDKSSRVSPTETRADQTSDRRDVSKEAKAEKPDAREAAKIAPAAGKSSSEPKSPSKKAAQ